MEERGGKWRKTDISFVEKEANDNSKQESARGGGGKRKGRLH
jgi:hypothetical protein